MLANQEILQFSSANSIIISNEKCRIVQLHEYVVTLQTTGQNQTATIDLNQFLPVVDETATGIIPELGMTIIDNEEGSDVKVTTEVLAEERGRIDINDVNGQTTMVKIEPDDDVEVVTEQSHVIRKSKRLSQPRPSKRFKQKVKTASHKVAAKAVAEDSDVNNQKDELADDNNDVYDSDGTVDLNESEDEKSIEPSQCDLFLDHEKFAGFPKVIIENSKLVFRGKKLLDLLSR